MKNNSLKTLLRREKELLSEIEDIKRTKKDIERNLGSKTKKLEVIRNQIAGCQKEVIVSEHAILRYIERVLGIDIEEVRKIIVDDDTEILIKNLKPHKINRGEYSIIVENNTVTTVIID